MRRQFVVIGLLVLALGACAWGQPGKDGSRTGHNPFDSGITAANAGRLDLEWQAAEGVDTPGGSVVVSDGLRLFRSIGVDNAPARLVAYAVDGGDACVGVPRHCAASWYANLPFTSSGSYVVPGQPIVAGGIVYVGGRVTDHVEVVGYDAAGAKNCSGVPVVCSPIWFASIANSTGGADLTAADGVLYVSVVPQGVRAYDAAGNIDCTGTLPRVCEPRFVMSAGSSRPAIAGGKLYADHYAFDAKGVEGCAARSCQPLFTLGSSSGHITVSGGIAFVDSSGIVAAFDASGIVGCGGTPTTCSPLYALYGGGITDFPTVTEDRAFQNTFIGGVGVVQAFDLTNTSGCRTPPSTCAPVWRAVMAGGIPYSPAANATLLFVVANHGLADSELLVFDQHPAGCAPGAPPTCAPLRTVAITDRAQQGPTLVTGHVVVGGLGSALRVFSVPPA